MIKTTKTGICDRCESECTDRINKLSLSSENLCVYQSATYFMPLSDGISFNFEGEGWHLCNSCLSDFRRFFEKTTINKLEGMRQ